VVDYIVIQNVKAKIPAAFCYSSPPAQIMLASSSSIILIIKITDVCIFLHLAVHRACVLIIFITVFTILPGR
jgi:hypothetical protein